MKGWVAANAFLILLPLATVGAVFGTTAVIFHLGLSPLNERIACVAAAVIAILAIGLLFRRLLARIQQRQ